MVNTLFNKAPGENEKKKKMMPLSLGNMILLKEKGGMREPIPGQVGKSRCPQGEKGLEFSRRRKRQTFFSLYIP